MKNWMRIISRIIAVAVLTVTLSAGFGASAADAGNPLTEGQLGLLKKLGILVDGNPSYEHNLTRAELAHMAAMLSKGQEYNKDAVYFYDVEEDTPHRADIYVLVAMGVLSGDGNGYFRPDDPVSDLEICKVFSVILGYQDYGHFQNYIRIARDAGITDGVAMDGVVTYGEALVMAYNTLHGEMFEAYAYGDEKKYSTTKGYLAIEHYHGLVYQEGIVDGIPYTTLVRPDNAIESGYISINGRAFLYNDESLLGKSVIFYSKRDGDTTSKEIDYLHVDEEKTKTFTIKGKDVKALDSANDELTYYVENKERTVKLDNSPDVIYNGVAYPEYTEADLKLPNGTLTLIDNNRDDLYDVILIVNYEYAVVKSVDEANLIVSTKYPEGTIGSIDQDVDMQVIQGRGKLRLNTLTEGKVIKVLKSKNLSGAMKIRINLVEGITGQVEGLDEKTVTIAGTKYTRNAATVLDDDLLIGEMVTVYSDGSYAAVIVHASNELYKFGYLLDVREEASAFDSTLEFRLVDLSRTLHELPMGKSIMIDESKFNKSDAILRRLSSAVALRSVDGACLEKEAILGGNAKWSYSQPVRYRINDAGELTHLDTLVYDSNYEQEDSLRPMEGADSKMQYLVYGSSTTSFYTGTEDDGLEFTLMNLSNTMMVPADNRDKVEAYYDAKGNIYDGTSYSVEAFTMDEESRIAKYAMVHYEPRTALPTWNRAYIISDISQVLDKDGLAVTQLTLVSGNMITATLADGFTINLANEDMSSELHIGDMIQLETNLKNEIIAVNKVFDMELGKDGSRIVNVDRLEYYALYNRCRVAYGTLLSVNGDVLTHTTSIKEDVDGVEARENLQNYRVGAAKCYVYEVIGGKPTINPITVGQLVGYNANKDLNQKTVMLSTRGSLYAVLVIKEG